MTVIFQDILDRVNDLVANYTTGSIDLGNRSRAANSAIEYLKRKMTLPSDEKIQTITFFSDTFYYNANADFLEGLWAVYNDPTLNDRRDREWNFAPYQELLKKLGNTAPREKWWSWTGINGKMQFLLYASNIMGGNTLNTFDSLGTSVGSKDAVNLAIDTNIFKEGTGSLSFDLDATKGNGKGIVTWSPTQTDFFNLLNQSGVFKLYVYLPSGNLSAINLYLLTDVGDYYKLTTSTFDDGTAFSSALNTWKKVQFGFTGDTVVGSPNIKNITQMQVEFVENASFGSAKISGFRIDDLFTVFPDKVDFGYITSNKGTKSDGVTNLTFLTDPSDIPSATSFIPDLLDPIVYRTALILIPQLLNNKEFRDAYKTEFKEITDLYGRSFPRKRAINLGRLQFRRPQ